jgi:hypothetical protein
VTVSMLCRIRHRRETVTPGSEGARRCDPSGPPDPEKYLVDPEDEDL